jgi:hypothetical protein
MREIVRGGRFELAGRRHAARFIAGHHLVMRGGVVEESGGRVTHRADERGLVHLLRKLRHDFAEPDAGNVGFDGLELAADIRGCVGLGVPDVDVARAALEEDEDDVLGLAPAALLRGRLGRDRRAGLKRKNVGEADPGHAEPANAEEFAAAETVAGAA